MHVAMGGIDIFISYCSPNRGSTIYQLLLPNFVETVSSFAFSYDRKFAFLAIGNEVNHLLFVRFLPPSRIALILTTILYRQLRFGLDL